MKRVETGKHKKGVVSGIIEKTRRPVYSYKRYTELWSEMWHNKDCKESGKNRSAYYWWLTCKKMVVWCQLVTQIKLSWDAFEHRVCME